MNIETLNAHLRVLGPAPKGKKWKMVNVGDKIPKSYDVTDVSRDLGGGGEYKNHGIASDGQTYERHSSVFPSMRLWHLVPAPPRPWRKDPLEVTRSILPVEELRRETVDGIIADFIKTVSDEKTFRAYLKAAKKGLTEADYD